jgi:hypothetical protein
MRLRGRGRARPQRSGPGRRTSGAGLAERAGPRRSGPGPPASAGYPSSASWL